jgi:hypothetical protein
VHTAAPANAMCNAMYSFYTGNRFARSGWGREQTYKSPRETAAFSPFFKNQNAHNMQGGKYHRRTSIFEVVKKSPPLNNRELQL